jgi:hypothetical protein
LLAALRNYQFGGHANFAPRTTERALDQICRVDLSCDEARASKDNVWVQFYPTLRKLIN